MAIKKAIYKVDNGSGFDEIYFKTSAEQIEESSSRRFVTDTEKSNWNGKASTSIASKTTNGLMSSSDKSKLDGIASGANAYVHPGTHPATMITGDSTHRFVTESERSSWNNKISVSDLENLVYPEIINFGSIERAVVTFNKSKMRNGVRVKFLTSNKTGTGSWHYAINGKWIDGWTTNGQATMTFNIVKLNNSTTWFQEVIVMNNYRETINSRRYDGSSKIHTGEMNTVMAYVDSGYKLENLTAIVEYY